MGSKINVPMWAADLAAELGGGWTVPVEHAHETGARIQHWDGRAIYVYVQAYGSAAWDKAEVSGKYPTRTDSNDTFQPRNSPDRISIGTRRDVKAAARDLTRRFLNDYTAAYTAGLALKAQHEEGERLRDRDVERIRATAPGMYDTPREGRMSWSPRVAGFGHFRVSSGGGGVAIEIHNVSTDVAVEIAEVLARHYPQS